MICVPPSPLFSPSFPPLFPPLLLPSPYSYQKQVEDNMIDLVSKMVETEKEEMSATHPPEVDINDHFYTTVGITLFQMIDQNTVEP